MKTRTITLEFDEDFYAALENHIEFLDYESIENYASALLITYALDTFYDLNELSNFIEREHIPLEYDGKFSELWFR